MLGIGIVAACSATRLIACLYIAILHVDGLDILHHAITVDGVEQSRWRQNSDGVLVEQIALGVSSSFDTVTRVASYHLRRISLTKFNVRRPMPSPGLPEIATVS